MRFCEPDDHTAATQLQEIQEVFKTINGLLSGTLEGVARK